MSFDVSIVPCGSYDMGEVRAALAAALAPLGGLDWVQPGMKIAVKVNLISAMRPDAAATVHPALLTALTELLQERGASVVLGDSPGGLFTAAHLCYNHDRRRNRPCRRNKCDYLYTRTVESPDDAESSRRISDEPWIPRKRKLLG